MENFRGYPRIDLIRWLLDNVKKDDIEAWWIGAVIRNDNGEVISALSKPMDGSFSTELGDYLALREGLLLAE
ncbi:hypothetical protein Ddye_030040 [Dipteronia dyeriana]|uniref:RNase H type-1 domain-containing protein n=1 Tax=Dipteronia dyeriana TaxID=168575 RepID=A0AAD9TG91_9ROSI|nr:hypothetical protein Ddye_030040 [Dipteronia dyeriana]